MKTMKSLRRVVACLLVCLTCLCTLGVAVSASAASGEEMTCTMNTTDTAKCDKVFADGTGLDGLTYSGGVFTWDGGEALSEVTATKQKAQIKKFMDGVSKANISAGGTSDISYMLGLKSENATVDMSILLLPYVFGETKGDIMGGMSILDGFLPYINVLIGVVAILLIAALVLSTVIDLGFMGLPQVREMLMANADKKGGGSGDGKKVKGVTYAASSAIMEVEDGDGSGKNVYFVYIKKRIFDYIILGICISFLVLGGFANFISAILEIGSGLLN